MPMSSRYMILGVVLLALALLPGGVLFMQPRRLVTLLARGSGDVLFFVDGAESAIALTIDDGPHGVTMKVITRRETSHSCAAARAPLSPTRAATKSAGRLDRGQPVSR